MRPNPKPVLGHPAGVSMPFPGVLDSTTLSGDLIAFGGVETIPTLDVLPGEVASRSRPPNLLTPFAIEGNSLAEAVALDNLETSPLLCPITSALAPWESIPFGLESFVSMGDLVATIGRVFSSSTLDSMDFLDVPETDRGLLNSAGLGEVTGFFGAA